MNTRLAKTVETAISNLRVRAFRHIHDLSILHQGTEQRGALVSRVTSDLDQISRFFQWGGLNLITSTGQVIVATVVMFVYSWQLTLVVLVSFLPFARIVRWFQLRLNRLYDHVRRAMGSMLGALAESVVAAPVVKAYGVEQRTEARVDDAIGEYEDVAVRAGWFSAALSGTGELFASTATAAVVVVGVLLGVGGSLSAGTLTAFFFLVTLFDHPVRILSETINEAQTAVAGWRRVLDILDLEPDVADPPNGVALPDGPLDIRFEEVSYAYPRAEPGVGPVGWHAAPLGPRVLREVDVMIPAHTELAVVGETGSGKTTFAKLLTRLMDPTSGRVTIGGVDVRDVRFDSLRRRIVMVPQDGTLLDRSITDNVAMGRPDIRRDEIAEAFTALGLDDWLSGLDRGLDTPVGERGGALSAGERQLVALVRAYVADPDILVLDEATSAVDPATEVRLQRALRRLAEGRTTVTIAHRMSTAERADDVLVFDDGRLVQRGRHGELVTAEGPYARLHASWSAGRPSAA
jgi:putative ABC transport system ATP-binding protein